MLIMPLIQYDVRVGKYYIRTVTESQKFEDFRYVGSL